jgi:hypothetical protein
LIEGTKKTQAKFLVPYFPTFILAISLFDAMDTAEHVNGGEQNQGSSSHSRSSISATWLFLNVVGWA